MRTTLSRVITLARGIAEAMCFVAVSAQNVVAGPITIGETTFPRGEDAWPTAVTCLNVPADCGADILFATFADPLLRPFGQALTLKFDNRLDGAYSDLNDGDDVRLDYLVPIINQPGADIYLGQAEWSGTSDLGFASPIHINDFGIKFDNAPTTWHTVVRTQFGASILPAQSVLFTDGGPLEGTSFKLWFTTIDLSDFGFALGESITGLDIRGQNVPASPDNAGLDVAIVASLNTEIPEPSSLVSILTLMMVLGSFPRNRVGTVNQSVSHTKHSVGASVSILGLTRRGNTH